MNQNNMEERSCIYGAAVMLKHLNDLRNEIGGVETADDIEFIHRMRVASRRLRSAFSHFNTCFPEKKGVIWQKHIRQVTKSLGSARDLDVQIEALQHIQEGIEKIQYRAGIHRLQLRLKQRREYIQPEVILAMNDLKNSGILEEMHTQFSELAIKEDGRQPYSLQLYQLAYQALSHHLNNLHAHEQLIFDPDQIEALHAMRIDAKHLRYTLEIFAPLYADSSEAFIKLVKSIQEMLGNIHDCDVWISFLPIFFEKEKEKTKKYYGHEAPFNLLSPGITYFMNAQRSLRDELYINFIDFWKTWKGQGVWEQFNQTIEQPVSFNTDAYPFASPGTNKKHSQKVEP